MKIADDEQFFVIAYFLIFTLYFMESISFGLFLNWF